jgi:F-type H+-transporting ATPase subunit delta
MKELTVAKVYAKAFLDLGNEQNIKVVDELIKLTEVLNKSNDLESVLFLDVFTTDEKKSVFDSVSKKLNLSVLVHNFINFLIDEKRMNLMPLIFKEAVVIDDHLKGFIKGTIEGATIDVPVKITEQVKVFLAKSLGKKPELVYKQNLNLSAGYKITVEDLQLDASLENQLEIFKQSVISENN